MIKKWKIQFFNSKEVLISKKNIDIDSKLNVFDVMKIIRNNAPMDAYYYRFVKSDKNKSILFKL